MQPFRVICETCNARLKVSSETVIGEIHACPKCGSMVAIKRPTDSQIAVSRQVNAETIELVAPVAASFEVSERFETPIPAVDAPESPVATVLPSAPATTGWSPATWWGIAAAALLMTGGLVTTVMLTDKDEPPAPPVVAQANEATDQNEESPAAEIEAIEKPAAVTPDEPPTVDAASNDPAALASDENKIATTPPVENATPTLPELPPAEDRDEAAADAAADTPSTENVATVADAPTESAAESATGPEGQSPVMSLDPLDFNPAQFSFDKSKPSSEQGSETKVPNNGDAEPPASEVATDLAKDTAAKPVQPPPAPTLTMRLGPMPEANKEKSPKPAAAQLAVRLGSLSVKDMPLARFVEMVSDLGDVPITLDPVQLQLAGLSPQQQVAVDISDTSAEKAFDTVLKKNRLNIVERGDSVSVALLDADRRREAIYDVADLCEDGKDAEGVANLIRGLVAPESWEEANGGTIVADGTKLRINHTQAVRHQVLIFVERLRLARGLPQRSRYPAALLRVRSPYDVLAPALAKRSTFTFLPWSDFADVIDEWQQNSKLTILVDWSALAEAGLGPASPVMSSAVDRPWSEVLDESLEEIGLGWWAVDGETVQITTSDALNKLRVIEFHIVPNTVRDQFASTASLVSAMQEDLSKLGDNVPAPPTIMAYDEPSGRLLVLGNAAAQRYLTKRFSPDARVAAHE